ncbi:MAG: tRNA (adenosine(37)-N6)-threonylcarbamoyltransferase complex ATPase subunit type 1 TsaE [Pseudomonadota bacterium]
MPIIETSSEEELLAFGERCGRCLGAGNLVFLEGDLGAGKTTWTRGLLRALGHTGPVPSPTYTLVESYIFEDLQVFHFDLYRLEQAEELEVIGIRDMLNETSLVIVEWPRRGSGVLPEPDYVLTLTHIPEGRSVVTNLDVDA